METCSSRSRTGAVKHRLTICKGCKARWLTVSFASTLGQKAHWAGPRRSSYPCAARENPRPRLRRGLAQSVKYRRAMDRARLPWAMALGASISLFSGRPESFQKTPDVEAVLDHLDDLYRSDSSVSRMEIRVEGRRTTRTLRMKAWTRGEEEVLVVIEEPPREAGTRR